MNHVKLEIHVGTWPGDGQMDRARPAEAAGGRQVQGPPRGLQETGQRGPRVRAGGRQVCSPFTGG